MDQYWKAVNLDKRQFLNPWNLGSGAKLREQLANPGPGQALIILLAAMPEVRGGGDLKPDPVIGSWAGDRVVIVGDYAEDSDLPTSPIPASELYGLTGCDCPSAGRFEDDLGLTHAAYSIEEPVCGTDRTIRQVDDGALITCMTCLVVQSMAEGFMDVTPLVKRVIEREIKR